MDLEDVWRHTHAERQSLAALLGTLDDAKWEVPSLCPGWTVRDVAAHTIHSPQYRVRDFMRMMITNRFDVNRAILVEGQKLGRAPAADILEAFETYGDSRSVPPGMTDYEPLIDILVHTQDIVRPLGIVHSMPVDAAREATDKVLEKSQKVFAPNHFDQVRVVATDTDWSRGSGPEVRAPIQEILVLATGRAADPALVDGEGVAHVRTA